MDSVSGSVRQGVLESSVFSWRLGASLRCPHRSVPSHERGNGEPWQVPCTIFLGAGDVDFHDQAKGAARETPGAEFISVEEVDHLGAHLPNDPVIPALLRRLRGNG